MENIMKYVIIVLFIFIFVLNGVGLAQNASIALITNQSHYQEGTPFVVYVKVGDPTTIQNLYGISFKLESSTGWCKYVDGSADSGSFLGSSVLRFFEKVNDSTVDMAVSKLASPGVSGSGILAKAQFIGQGSGTISLSLQDIVANDQDGNSISFDQSSLQLTIDPIIITAGIYGHGTISPSGTDTVTLGTNQTFTITPDSGYRVDSVVVDGSMTDSLLSYTFINIVSNHSIAAYLSAQAIKNADTATVTIDTIEAFPADTVSIPVYLHLPKDSILSSFELSIDGFTGLGKLLSIDTSIGLLGAQSWQFVYNNLDSVVILATAGATSLNTDGLLFHLRLLILDTTKGFMPLQVVSSYFNHGQTIVHLITGGVNVHTITYGDVFIDGSIHSDDAAEILKYNADPISHPLNNQQRRNADVTKDGTVSELDASLVLQYVVRRISHLPVDTSGGIYRASGTIRFENTTVKHGELLTFPLLLQNANNILAFHAVVSYDTSQLMFQGINPVSPLNHFTILTKIADGKVILSGADSIAHGQNEVFASLVFTVKPGNGTTTVVRLISLRWNEEPVMHDVASANVTITGVEENGNEIPDTYQMEQNYPNPFNPTTTIIYQLPTESFVHLSIFNVLGQEVRTLVNNIEHAGFKSVQFDASNLPSGVYFYRIKVGDYNTTKKLIYMK